MAYSANGANSRATQVFVNKADNAYLDKQGYAPFGEVVSGMGAIEKLHQGEQAQPSHVRRLRLAASEL
jgi:cyclophilin family peptidyl-prolyl cis-trans isomerase